MKPNGEGMTEQELKDLPEIKNKVLWQDDNGPTTVIDSEGAEWFIGTFNDKLYKRRAR